MNTPPAYPTISPTTSSIYPPNAPLAMPLKVVGYARVSTDLQREKETIKTQIELIEKYCDDRGHTLVEIYCDDGVSGTIHLHDRPSGARLVADAAAGKFAAIVVYKADRFGRDVLVNETAVRNIYDGRGIDFLGIAETIDLSTPIGRAMFTFQSAIGRLERENTLQRSMDATLRLARDGVWLGGIVPYGYRVQGKGREARLVVSDELIPGFELSEADVIRLIFTMSALQGKSSTMIANALNEIGVPPCYKRDGRQVIHGKSKVETRGVWTVGRIRNMTIEPTYRGLHIWGRRGSQKKGKKEPKHLIERAVAAIVDESLWFRAQETLRRNCLSRPDIVKRKFLLRGLMKCSCGASFVGSSMGGNEAKLTDAECAAMRERGEKVPERNYKSYYFCNARKNEARNGTLRNGAKPTVSCGSGYLRASDVERLLWSQVEAMLREPAPLLDMLGKRLIERAGDPRLVEEQLQRIEEEIAGGDVERGSLFRLFRKGSITEADLERQLDERLQEDNELRAKAEALRLAVAQAQSATHSLEASKLLLGELGDLIQSPFSSSDSYNNEPKAEAEPTMDGPVELGWETRRRVIEELVEGVVVEHDIDPNDPRGKRLVYTLRVRYNFEDKYSGQAAAGLTLDKSVEILGDRLTGNCDARVEWVRAVLEESPGLWLEQIEEIVFKRHGVHLSKASLSRYRKMAGFAPNTIQSRAASAKFNKAA